MRHIPSSALLLVSSCFIGCGGGDGLAEMSESSEVGSAGTASGDSETDTDASSTSGSGTASSSSTSTSSGDGDDGGPTTGGEGDATTTDGDGDGDGPTTGGDGDFPGGEASVTHYTGIDEGRCGFQAIPNDVAPQGRIAALPTWLFGGAEWCGAFIELDSSNGDTFESCGGVTGATLTVMVSDECPASTNQEHCYDGAWHFDLSQPAFSDMADLSCGVVENIGWKVVEGTHAGNVRVRNKDGINQWWYSLFILDHNYAITQVELRENGGDWQAATRSDTNFWNVESTAGLALPLDVRITDLHGQVITGEDVVTNLDENAVFDMGSQFSAGMGGGGTLGP